MRYFLRTFLASLLLVVGLSASHAVDDPAPAVQEITDSFQREADAIELDAAEQLSKLRLQAAEKLQEIQDRLCRDAKLDEALAVREQARHICGKPTNAWALTSVDALPVDAGEVARAYQLAVTRLERETTERLLAAGHKAAEPLERLLKELCRDAKLDESVAVRNLIRQLTGVIRDVKPDPGQLRADASQIGQVWYFEVVGNTSGSIYGTEIFTSDSSLAMAAVHSGVLVPGERGIVKVTILPGQSNYVSSTRHGITSHAYSSWGVSFKVERTFGIVKPKFGAATTPPQGMMSSAPVHEFRCGNDLHLPQTPRVPEAPRVEPPLPPKVGRRS